MAALWEVVALQVAAVVGRPETNTMLTPYILMDSSFWFDTIHLG